MALASSERVRAVRPEEVEPVARELARAFAIDPGYRWLLPAEREWARAAPRLFAALIRDFAETGLALTDPGGSGAALGHAAERRPRPWPVEAAFSLRLAWLFGRRLGRAAAFGRALAAARPAEPHGYLAVLGIAPECQRRGVGSELLASFLARCDAAGMPAYLETSREANVAFYARHGFAVRTEIPIRDGPRLWTLWREAG
jgi:GNAT superfamily N-acetyltransferase